MSAVLAWAWLFTIPGLILTLAGVGGSRRAGIASIWGPLVIFLVALGALFSGPLSYNLIWPGWLPFLPDGDFHLRVDGLSALMLAVVGFVSFLIYVYSLAYMEHDPGRRRYFAYLDFFVGAMALLVLGGTLAMLLIGWSCVGLASFLLISFWRDRPNTLSSGLQALAANMVGDAALLLAAALVPVGCGDLTTLNSAACTAGFGGATLIAWLLLIAASAKSAQGPLYFWIPTAMAGPTPVSALIHAATMVAAGVYLLVRTHALMELSPSVLAITAWVGTITMLVGGIIGIFQRNFKRGLAYSTISQIGYMFAAVGLAAPFAAFFHLFTHAFFKALLFLAAGVVIHATGDEEDMYRLGGLRRVLPISFIGFLVGVLAIIGLPVVTAGGISKDAIIEAGFLHNLPIGVLLLAGALITGIYIGRLMFLVYFGPERTPAHPGEAPPFIIGMVPLIIASIAAGWLEWPLGSLSRTLAPVLGTIEPVQGLTPLGLAAGALGLLGLAIAWFIVRGVPSEAVAPAALSLGWAGDLGQTGNMLAARFAAVQTGRFTRYALASVVGVAVILFLAAQL